MIGGVLHPVSIPAKARAHHCAKILVLASAKKHAYIIVKILVLAAARKLAHIVVNIPAAIPVQAATIISGYTI